MSAIKTPFLLKRGGVLILAQMSQWLSLRCRLSLHDMAVFVKGGNPSQYSKPSILCVIGTSALLWIKPF
jgi:hypothetical protein